MDTSGKRLDIGELTLLWGDPTRAKAELRAESLRKHLERPIGDRLAAALGLVEVGGETAPDRVEVLLRRA